MEKEFKDPRGNKVVILVAVICAVLVVSFIAFLFFKYKSDETEKEKVDDKEVVIEPIEYDPSIPITKVDLNKVMDKAVEEIYGTDFYTLVESEEVINLPNTEMYLESWEVNDALDLMTLHAVAVQRNPYAFIDDKELSVRELPDGTDINLGMIFEEFTELKFGYDKETPALAQVQGYSNGEWFMEDIDLTTWYEAYY